MIYGKTEKRIAQYLTYLDRVKYTPLRDLTETSSAMTGPWEYGITDRIFRTPPDGTALDWKPLPGFPFSYGSDETTWWFRTLLDLPENLKEKDIFLEADTKTDTLVFVNGIPTGAVNPFHEKIRLTENVSSGKPLEIALEAWAGHTFPGYHPFDGPRVLTTVAHRQESYPLVLPEPRLLVKDREVYDLYYDAAVLYETALLQEEGSLLLSRITRDLHRALLHLDFTSDRETRLNQAARVREEIRPLLKMENGTLAPRIRTTGNAHLDHAWLWPMAETSRKCARTCANMAAFTEEFPEFRYLHSQPVQMLDLKENYPEVFRRVKQAVDRGQWEPNGGMWVEADCNLSGGESLIRQFLLGRRTTEELFGYRGNVLWLPDVFGYSACLPQIMKGCGIDYFVTSKISWNDTTRFPFDLFQWEGLDGTRIPTHFITTAYEGRNTPAEAAEAWNRVQHKEVQSSLMRSVGEGDGGGGTMRADLEYMRRMKNLQGIPRNGWSGLSESMDRIFSEEEELPVYSGELYLELHRGTYTTQAAIKRNNRKLEYALRELELKEARLFLSGTDAGRREADGLHGVIDKAWKELLTLQFHDILPGTSIRQVNEEALNTYGQIRKRLAAADSRANGVLCGTAGSGSDFSVNSSLPFPRKTVVTLPPEAPAVTAPAELTVQEIRDTDGRTVRVALAETAGLSLEAPVSGRTPGQPEMPFRMEGDFLETPWYSLRFDTLGGISEMTLNGSGRTIAADGMSLNAFMMTEDLPVNWDAWDIEDDYRLKESREGRLLSREVLSSGPVCLQLRQKLAVGRASELTQDIFFYAHTPRIDFKTRVDWREDHRLLRVNFPTAVNARRGYFDIPFGYAMRETHRNRPEDRARFEVCAHKWAFIRDTRTAAALLSDCKYGYRAEGGLLSLTLLRAPSAPDPLADRGNHEFTYAFLPTDDTDIRNVIREGWDLNIPAGIIPGRAGEGLEEPLFRLTSKDVMIESVKVSEDRRGIILRLWETTGAPLEASVCPASASGLPEAVETNMLEDPLGDPEPVGEGFALSFRGFEVKTLKFLTA